MHGEVGSFTPRNHRLLEGHGRRVGGLVGPLAISRMLEE
jgi:hypothetical protein